MATYDNYYKQTNYFGNPYPELIDFFNQAKKGSLVDLVAGQGRDSIPLSNMGYEVTSVDISQVGINQIKEIDSRITALVSDIYSFNISGYSYILLDSMLHFYKKDREKEATFLKQILSQMDTRAILVNCLLKNEKAETLLKNTIKEFETEIIRDKYIKYPDFNSIYHFYVIKKL